MRIRFKKPKMQVIMTEVIILAVWLFFGDKIVQVLNGFLGTNTPSINWTSTAGLADAATNSTKLCLTGSASIQSGGETWNPSVFQESYKMLGVGYNCQLHSAYVDTVPLGYNYVSNASNGLLGIVALIMVVLILMNFVQFN